MDAVPAQAGQVVTLAERLLGGNLMGVYLHGSSVSGGLHPQSDLDLLLVSRSRLTDRTRAQFLEQLLNLSSRYPRPPGTPRCLDVLAMSREDLQSAAYPARSEFIYGEWLRAGFEGGEVLSPVSDPVVTLMIAQARKDAVALVGPDYGTLMPHLPADHVPRALLDSLQPLLDNLRGDERNVLLTLARMWRTATDGEFVPKDVAADWAAARLSPAVADILGICRDAYRAGDGNDWQRDARRADQAAEVLRGQIQSALADRSGAR